ncbi:uncharacterized protein [Watersipora subatra]|uniref:uncharacterized protein n=1 Tax=Watersipora subatra TaxID=2589382 RepID=UPI00355B4827
MKLPTTSLFLVLNFMMVDASRFYGSSLDDRQIVECQQNYPQPYYVASKGSMCEYFQCSNGRSYYFQCPDYTTLRTDFYQGLSNPCVVTGSRKCARIGYLPQPQELPRLERGDCRGGDKCLRGGECHETTDFYWCSCPPGYTGIEQCQKAIQLHDASTAPMTLITTPSDKQQPTAIRRPPNTNALLDDQPVTKTATVGSHGELQHSLTQSQQTAIRFNQRRTMPVTVTDHSTIWRGGISLPTIKAAPPTTTSHNKPTTEMPVATTQKQDVRRPEVQLGDSCTAKDKVHRLLANSECFDNFVRCKPKYYADGLSLCAKEAKLGARCSNSGACRSKTTNSECSRRSGRCQCLIGFRPSNGFCITF